MTRCFVMQPFDSGEFDKRYDDVIAPAIRDAKMEPYRVDRDPSVTIPIDDIEIGIRNSEICLAEITTDNPNVWFELGYAIAVPRDVILVCGDRTTRFPFDIQHRSIIKYKTDSPQDFKRLQEEITVRIKAILEKGTKIQEAASSSPLKETEGLSQHEIVALVTVLQNGYVAPGSTSGWTIRNDMQRAGFTDIAIGFALKLLKDKGMIAVETLEGFNEPEYFAYAATATGEGWLLANQDKLVMRRADDDEADAASTHEEVPF